MCLQVRLSSVQKLMCKQCQAGVTKATTSIPKLGLHSIKCATHLCMCLQVRANSLQELVYKQGQAGVTKATVSIVFNNSDKANGPVEYQHLDQITVTRQVQSPTRLCFISLLTSTALSYRCACTRAVSKMGLSHERHSDHNHL